MSAVCLNTQGKTMSGKIQTSVRLGVTMAFANLLVGGSDLRKVNSFIWRCSVSGL